MYTAFDAFFYPLDLMKTLKYADTINLYSGTFVATELGNVSFLNMYRGLKYKLLANIPWFWTLSTTVNENSDFEKGLAWVFLALTYPLHTLKTRTQLLETPLTHINSPNSSFMYGAYKGLTTFLLANALGHILLYNFAGKARKEKYYDVYEKQIRYYNQASYFDSHEFC